MIALEPSIPGSALDAIRAPFLARGAESIDVPVMQPLGMLLDLAGEAMRARLFVVQADGIDEACLRPDFTIPVASAHLKSGKVSGRYLYEGKAFQVAPPGSDRAEEFLQVGLEILGEGGSRASDGEALALAWRSALAGGRKDLKIRMGDVSLFAGFIDALGLHPTTAARLKRAFVRPGKMAAELARAQAPDEGSREGDRVAELLAGLPEVQAAAALEELWTLAGIEPVGGRSAAEIVHRLAERATARSAPRVTAAEAELITRFLSIEGRPAEALDRAAAISREAGAGLDGLWADWAERLGLLSDAGAPEAAMTLSTGFGRAFGYYDGFLFEVWSESLGQDISVAAGGRYDSLLRRMGAPDQQGIGGLAVGCMVRPARAWSGS
jgi:ATP phosphoribosyltransferase regulatory subunit